ncbi:4Fe-4S dicluster domain-containing protein [Adlercreutzia sp. ZJ473]|uniref:4Fe-4S dicluster domain-containing protein n=1 Tax=Adlercreutzia sp. ZJ473 TaxID=2722822 RepID=UPI0020A67064|nr:4Fe-4S dicluster domain-containing protein [Adlercreutzia sp. ZJ473]
MMLKLFKEIRKTGCGTVGYPYAPLDLPKGYRGKPSHDEAACIACGACAVACPPNAISMELSSEQDQITWAINYGRCVFCGRCEEVCPTFAVKLSEEFELAVMSKDDLEESCAYPVATCARCGKPYASAKEIDYARRVLAQAGGGEAAGGGAPAAASEAPGAPAASAGSPADVAASLSKIGLCLECRRRDDGVAAVRHAPAQGGALC